MYSMYVCVWTAEWGLAIHVLYVYNYECNVFFVCMCEPLTSWYIASVNSGWNVTVLQLVFSNKL